MKNFLRLSLAMMVLFCSSCSQNEPVKISGTVKFIGENNKVTITQSDGFKSITIAETTINPDNTYSLEVIPTNPGVVTISCCQSQFVTAWLEDEDMVINFRGIDTAKIKIYNPPYVHIEAGPKNDLLNLSNWMSYIEYQTGAAFSQAIYSKPELTAQEKQTLFNDIYRINNRGLSKFDRYLLEHNSHLTSCLALLPRIKFEEDSAFVLDVIAKIERANPGDTLAKAYLERLRVAQEKKRRVEIGREAPIFSATDKEGQQVSIADFKGKVLIVDFWASWCGPCRAEIPSLKEIYNSYKDNNEVAFLSVSIDSDKEDWLKALEEEKMEWPQIWCDDAGKEVMDKYQFNGIPFIIAIDKEGKIAGKHLRGEAVREAIANQL